MFKVPSFNLDHDKVRAPYVRLCDHIETPHGDVIEKFDIRFTQPNQAYLDGRTMHTIEHIVAELSRDEFPHVVDFSPMGCRTGFYLTLQGTHTEAEVGDGMVRMLEKLASWEGPIPGASRKTCGNWQYHDLDGAKKAARAWIDGVKAKGYGPYGA